MANAPFKLRSGNTPLFKTMGSSPAYATDPPDGVPRKKQSIVTENKTYEKGPVKGPEDTDVMDIIRKRKQSGPKDSKENQQKEIDKLVEKDPTAGKGKSVAKPKKDFTETEAREKEADKKKKKKVIPVQTPEQQMNEDQEVEDIEEKEADTKIKRDADGKVIKPKSIYSKIYDTVKEKGMDYLDDLSDRQKESSSEKRNRRRKRREEFLKKEEERTYNKLIKGPLHPDNLPR